MKELEQDIEFALHDNVSSVERSTQKHMNQHTKSCSMCKWLKEKEGYCVLFNTHIQMDVVAQPWLIDNRLTTYWD